jgi:hypothetical protein
MSNQHFRDAKATCSEASGNVFGTQKQRLRKVRPTYSDGKTNVLGYEINVFGMQKQRFGRQKLRVRHTKATFSEHENNVLTTINVLGTPNQRFRDAQATRSGHKTNVSGMQSNNFGI